MSIRRCKRLLILFSVAVLAAATASYLTISRCNNYRRADNADGLSLQISNVHAAGNPVIRVAFINTSQQSIYLDCNYLSSQFLSQAIDVTRSGHQVERLGTLVNFIPFATPTIEIPAGQLVETIVDLSQFFSISKGDVCRISMCVFFDTSNRKRSLICLDNTDIAFE
jgi:hypothetical protein